MSSSQKRTLILWAIALVVLIVAGVVLLKAHAQTVRCEFANDKTIQGVWIEFGEKNTTRTMVAFCRQGSGRYMAFYWPKWPDWHYPNAVAIEADGLYVQRINGPGDAVKDITINRVMKWAP